MKIFRLMRDHVNSNYINQSINQSISQSVSQSVKIYFPRNNKNYNVINAVALERLPEKHYTLLHPLLSRLRTLNVCRARQTYSKNIIH